MRKNFITKEYSSEPVAGTLAMKELRNFFSSKILEISDIIKIDENDIIWTQSIDKTQGLGVDNQNHILDTNQLKSDNHTLRIYPNQSLQDKQDFTQWEFNFNIKNMIQQYLFAELKRSKAFIGITNINTQFNDIDKAIEDYINQNILPRIKFDTIELFIKYYAIGETQENNVLALQFDNKFREDIILPTPLSGESTIVYQNRILAYQKQIQIKNFQILTDATQTNATLIYKQIQTAKSYKFDYYYNVIYQKA